VIYKKRFALSSFEDLFNMAGTAGNLVLKNVLANKNF